MASWFSSPWLSRVRRDAYLARNRTTGLLNGASTRGMDRAYVIYPGGMQSMNMPIGNAHDYAKIFGGTVVPVKESL